jgi:imidazole glycerol-phosphate synthase subunit HisH
MSVAPEIAVVDYGMGNRRSVVKALEHVGAAVSLTGDLERIASADGLVVPGVGAFAAAMRSLSETGLDQAVAGAARRGRPVLGICLGMQLLFDRSHELGLTDGLGLIAGEVTRLQVGTPPVVRIPHIGWNEVRFERASPLLDGLPESGAFFYHVHSFAVRPADPAVVGTTEYGERFATIVASGNVFGTQFHPEKSSTHGLALLRAFVTLCGGGGDRVSVSAAGAAHA